MLTCLFETIALLTCLFETLPCLSVTGIQLQKDNHSSKLYDSRENPSEQSYSALDAYRQIPDSITDD